MEDVITLDYGSGGVKTSRLIEEILLPAFHSTRLDQLGDGALLPPPSGPLVFSTDSFVVSPWRVPGGDIGKLAVCGTVNDLSVSGARPLYLSLSFILEEGFSIRDFRTIVDSIACTAKSAGVEIVTGDTKVVERGKGDGIYINTSGIGVLLPEASGLGPSAIRPGDAVLLSGTPGCHGAAVLMARGELPCEGNLASDCMALNQMCEHVLKAVAPGSIRVMRDPTRGGVATTLNEFVEHTPLTIELEEKSLPSSPAVSAACSLLGLDPLYCACEGRVLIIAAEKEAPSVPSALRQTKGGSDAAIIGRVTAAHPGYVVLCTPLGGSRILGKLSGNQLPRIC